MLTCSICINNEKTSKIKIIDGKLICKECLVYLSHKSDKNKIQAELKELMKSIDKAIVAFSEGKRQHSWPLFSQRVLFQSLKQL